MEKMKCLSVMVRTSGETRRKRSSCYGIEKVNEGDMKMKKKKTTIKRHDRIRKISNSSIKRNVQQKLERDRGHFSSRKTCSLKDKHIFIHSSWNQENMLQKNLATTANSTTTTSKMLLPSEQKERKSLQITKVATEKSVSLSKLTDRSEICRKLLQLKGQLHHHQKQQPQQQRLLQHHQLPPPPNCTSLHSPLASSEAAADTRARENYHHLNKPLSAKESSSSASSSLSSSSSSSSSSTIVCLKSFNDEPQIPHMLEGAQHKPEYQKQKTIIKHHNITTTNNHHQQQQHYHSYLYWLISTLMLMLMITSHSLCVHSYTNNNENIVTNNEYRDKLTEHSPVISKQQQHQQQQTKQRQHTELAPPPSPTTPLVDPSIKSLIGLALNHDETLGLLDVGKGRPAVTATFTTDAGADDLLNDHHRQHHRARRSTSQLGTNPHGECSRISSLWASFKLNYPSLAAYLFPPQATTNHYSRIHHHHNQQQQQQLDKPETSKMIDRILEEAESILSKLSSSSSSNLQVASTSATDEQQQQQSRARGGWLSRALSNPYYAKIIQHFQKQRLREQQQQQQQPFPVLTDNNNNNNMNMNRQQEQEEHVYGRIIQYPHELSVNDNQQARTLDKLHLLNRHANAGSSQQQQKSISDGGGDGENSINFNSNNIQSYRQHQTDKAEQKEEQEASSPNSSNDTNNRIQQADGGGDGGPSLPHERHQAAAEQNSASDGEIDSARHRYVYGKIILRPNEASVSGSSQMTSTSDNNNNNNNDVHLTASTSNSKQHALYPNSRHQSSLETLHQLSLQQQQQHQHQNHAERQQEAQTEQHNHEQQQQQHQLDHSAGESYGRLLTSPPNLQLKEPLHRQHYQYQHQTRQQQTQEATENSPSSKWSSPSSSNTSFRQNTPGNHNHHHHYYQQHQAMAGVNEGVEAEEEVSTSTPNVMMMSSIGPGRSEAGAGGDTTSSSSSIKWSADGRKQSTLNRLRHQLTQPESTREFHVAATDHDDETSDAFVVNASNEPSSSSTSSIDVGLVSVDDQASTTEETTTTSIKTRASSEGVFGGDGGSSVADGDAAQGRSVLSNAGLNMAEDFEEALWHSGPLAQVEVRPFRRDSQQRSTLHQHHQHHPQFKSTTLQQYKQANDVNQLDDHAISSPVRHHMRQKATFGSEAQVPTTTSSSYNSRNTFVVA